MSCGIYKYENQINGKIYIGLSSNIEKRYQQHLSAAKWAKCGATTLTRHLVTDGVAGKVPDTQEPASWVEIP